MATGKTPQHLRGVLLRRRLLIKIPGTLLVRGRLITGIAPRGAPGQKKKKN
jgi:hypothetical protein